MQCVLRYDTVEVETGLSGAAHMISLATQRLGSGRFSRIEIGQVIKVHIRRLDVFVLLSTF